MNQIEPLTLGQRSADAVAATFGSWRFVIAQSCFLFIWILWNSIMPASWRFDPYPFTFLNLMLSFQAAYSAPFIMMSQNRQAEIDRSRAIEDYEVDKKAEIEVEDVQDRLRRMEKMMEVLIDNQIELSRRLGDANK